MRKLYLIGAMTVCAFTVSAQYQPGTPKTVTVLDKDDVIAHQMKIFDYKLDETRKDIADIKAMMLAMGGQVPKAAPIINPLETVMVAKCFKCHGVEPTANGKRITFFELDPANPSKPRLSVRLTDYDFARWDDRVNIQADMPPEGHPQLTKEERALFSKRK